jgi:hypothetical protein
VPSGAPSFGGEAAQVAKMMGVDLLPWQRRVFDVALEHDGDGNLRYREVVVTVPRQSGKSLALLVLSAWRLTLMARRVTPVLAAAGRPDRTHRVYATAQTGEAMRKKFRGDWVPMFTGTKLAPFVTGVRLANGSERLSLADPEGGWASTLSPVPASNRSAAHGNVVDLAIMDEAFADSDDSREQALRPGMNTRPSPQLWVVSTAGDDLSLYLRRKVDRGRVGLEQGDLRSTAYFEWSAPDDADADDPGVWAACMPALGGITPVEAIESARESMPDGEFRRAYLNQWVQGDEKVIPMDSWMRCEAQADGVSGDPVFALDMNPLRTHATLAVSDGHTVEVVACREGDVDAAVSDAVRACRGSHRLVVDQGSPAHSKVAELRAAGVTVVEVGFAECKDAAGELFDLVRNERLAVMHHDQLSKAAEGARKRMYGDRFTWTRNHPDVDLTPLTAVTLALHGARRHQPIRWGWLMGEN